MVRLSASLVALSVFAGVLATPLKRDATTIVADVTDLKAKTDSLDSQIVAFTSPTDILGALNIHTASQALDTAVKTDTGHVTCPDGPFSDADATSILTAVSGLKTSVEKALTDLIAKHDTFKAVPLGNIIGTVHGDLVALGGDTATYGSALVACASPATAANAAAAKAEIDNAFNTAIAAYAS